MGNGDPRTERIFCNSCKRITSHVLRVNYSRPRIVGEGEQPGEFLTSIWTCAGCDQETFERKLTLEDGWQSDPVYIPPREEPADPEESVDPAEEPIQGKDFPHLSAGLAEVYREVVVCFNQGCLVLCIVGLRALIEGVCVEKGCAKGDLQEKINCLARLIPNIDIIEALHAFREAGNDAVHRREAPGKEQLKQSVHVTEELISYLYELDQKAILARSVSKRAVLRDYKPGTVQ